MERVKSGDHVRMMFYGRYVFGEVTIVRETDAKVIWESDCDLNYDYYPLEELEIMTEKDLQDND